MKLTEYLHDQLQFLNEQMSSAKKRQRRNHAVLG